LVILAHQLGYFDILPLYVALTCLAPLVAVVHRVAPRLLLPLSFAIYAAAMLLRLNAPTWPVEGEWYFNPFAWQFIYVLGFLMARDTMPDRPLARALPTLRWPAIAFLLVSLWAVRTHRMPEPTLLPAFPYLVISDKTYLTPLRLVHVLALCTAFVAVYSGISLYLPRLARFGSMLGRNSLQVFCVGSLLSLAGQLIRVAFPVSILLDLAVVGAGVLIMWGTAWLSEARHRLRE
jgi:hypothetical protein